MPAWSGCDRGEFGEIGLKNRKWHRGRRKGWHLGPCVAAGTCDTFFMSIATLQQEVQALPAEDHDKLAAFLLSLRMKRDGLLEEISRRLDDRDPSGWVEWNAVKGSAGKKSA